MFIAKKENGEIISLAKETDRKFLLKLRENELFFCPCCKNEVILKLGLQRSYHFAHLQNKACTFQIEPESEYHMSGKLQIYNYLQKNKFKPILEPFINEIKQRPDIMFQYKGKKIVVEYQCSPISGELFSKRTRRYLVSNYYPIWILGANLLKRLSANTFSISNFQSLFFTERQNEWRLNYYCPNARKFVVLKQLTPLSTRNIYANINVFNEDNMCIDDLLFHVNNEKIIGTKSLVESTRKLLQKNINTYPLHPGARRSYFLKELYKNGLTIQDISSMTGFPLKSAILIKTPPFIWQFYIYLDNFHNKQVNQLIYRQDIIKNFNKRIKNEQITLRKYLFFKNSYFYNAIDQYLQLLVEISFLIKLDDDTFKLSANFAGKNKEGKLSKKLVQKISELFLTGSFN